MGAGRDFGHDAAVNLMQIKLGADDVREDFATAAGIPRHNRRGGFIAACLDAKHHALRDVSGAAWAHIHLLSCQVCVPL